MEVKQQPNKLRQTIHDSYAGKSGKNISGIEIRVYEEGAIGDFSGGEATALLSYMADSTSNWNSFERSTVASHIDGIKMQTTNKPYYLLYKTWNSGQSSYYPAVKSTDNDYAGSAGKPIQRLNIQAYKNDGTKLVSGVIVMYRAYVNGEWLPWVSNADPEWMRNVQNKYSLGGTLDTGGSFAGEANEDISGIEIRIFEDDSLNAGTDDFSGDELSLSLSYMADSNDNWNGFNGSVTAPHIDGIRIQTDSAQPFYLLYKTLNSGRDTYYPEVSSTGNDYAGSAGKPIQRLSIHAYQNDGTKLTSGIVVMYRALVDGRWLPWVSNADPVWMRGVQTQYNLGGTLDLDASYAGASGKNISGIEIRAFKGDTNLTPIEDLPGTETTPSLSYMYDSISNWHSFDKSVMSAHIDGIKIQTNPNKQYYIKYQTWNSGLSSYYPEVASTENDYAGSAGKPIQRVGLHVYRSDGVKLTTGVVVMLRAYVDGNWLPWVSNADPEWMRSVQSKYDLGGTLDTNGYYAGIAGKNISGIEIRVFEENGINTTPTTPTGNYKIIQAPFISQLGDYPTGCESVTAVMALNYAGINTSVDTFIDTYLDKSTIPFDPNLTFGGDPRSSHSYGCYSPVIKKALDRVLSGKGYEANILNSVSLETLCSQYIDEDIPVIMWATMYMNPPYIGSTWTFNGRPIQWIAPEHCLLLVGYDDNNYIFNDPLQTQALKFYSKSSVEAAYKGLSSQAIVILKKLNRPFNEANHEALEKELSAQVESDIDWLHKLGKWHSSEEALSNVLKYDNVITNICNQFSMQKALLQTVIFREQRFVWFADDVADGVVMGSYNYDAALAEWMKLSPAQQLIVPAPQIPIPYRHDCSTGLSQIFAATAIKAINFAVDQGIISDERKYNGENLDDLKTIWYKLKDNDTFNIKCATLTLIYESLSTLGYQDNFVKYSMDQIAMVFTKYNSLSDMPNDYGKDCAEWYKIFNKYNN
ncbi:C39 family peptidase [Caproicibacter fermentans]|nr:C39 family peptidase [Caproicibacter fermentans]